MKHITMIIDYNQDKTEQFDSINDTMYNKCKTPVYEVENTLTPKAIMHHEQLWPNYPSSLKDTDPDLIEIFDNFAYDEVISHDNMKTKTRVLVILASTIGSQALTEYKMYVQAALNIGITPIEIKEVLYQSVPYVGMSKVIDFIFSTNAIFNENNISLPLKSQATTIPETRLEEGLAIQKEIFGKKIDDFCKNVPKDLLHIQHYLADNCFGDYITRKGLDTKTREMITLSFLIALGGTESQIKDHIKGNANVGNSRQDLINLMTQLLPYVGYSRTIHAINCLNEVFPSK
ncbi:carboxymuconolactone decarboxylase family protein [Flavobacterium sp. J27]|uniref:carboxymuconolactone decarboxylase family protein n=1 Tax=Flavobacterium sp. J27 TaxID=2060419 RepID=UPI0010307BAE|nr:carboxymuconolactone decarboxylase family protein [Flavobacterium sp. J27]